MDDKKLEALAKELAKDIKSEKDLSDLSRRLVKLTVETALNAEIEDHLGYPKNNLDGRNTGNSRNGFTPKTLKGNFGRLSMKTPRDRNGTFNPKFVKKGQTRLTQFDDQILSLYAKGMTTRDIVATFKEMYDADVSHSLISKVTDSVLEKVHAWQNRPLDDVYPIIYLDCIVVKIRHDNQIMNKAVYLALGINSEGYKELMGIWIAETEGAKFWLSVLTELKNRGLKDIFIACVDGLKGFPDAIKTVYPEAKIQLCIVHMVRNSLKYVPHKNKKQVANDLKNIYNSPTLAEAEKALDNFSENWDKKYPAISKSWRSHWDNLITIFDYPMEIRRIIYTTNAIESLNSVIRKAIRNRKIFPNDTSACKIIYLAIMSASKRWSMPLRNWKPAMNRFAIEFEGRFHV
jgi:putative transposase